jgi:transitional endoplasmic reticulum ATPase
MEGYTGADIASVASTAVMLALREHISKYRDPKEAEKNAKELKIAMQNFRDAMKKIRPLSTQELNMYKRIAEQFAMPSRSTTA